MVIPFPSVEMPIPKVIRPAAVITAACLLLAPAWARAAGEETGAAAEGIVVIDPGHGGGDQGINSPAGLLEKDLTLSLARRLKNKLETNLGLKVILTRSGDYDVSPLERAAMANHNKADLFVSIHLGGAASQTADNFMAFVAEPRPVRDGAPQAAPPSWLPWNEQNGPHREAGRRLARAFLVALSTWLAREAVDPLGGDWLVLKGVGCPAAMVELGSLANPERERTYLEKSFMDELSSVLFEAVNRYLEDDLG